MFAKNIDDRYRFAERFASRHMTRHTTRQRTHRTRLPRGDRSPDRSPTHSQSRRTYRFEESPIKLPAEWDKWYPRGRFVGVVGQTAAVTDPTMDVVRNPATDPIAVRPMMCVNSGEGRGGHDRYCPGPANGCCLVSSRSPRVCSSTGFNDAFDARFDADTEGVPTGEDTFDARFAPDSVRSAGSPAVVLTPTTVLLPLSLKNSITE